VAGLENPQLVWTSTSPFWPEDITSDGAGILVSMEDSVSRRWGIYELSLADTATLRPIVQPPGNVGWSALSPDDRWLAYMSDESGQEEVYVTTFPQPTGKWQVSAAEGDRPKWRSDGRELYYLNNTDVITAAAVEGSATSFRVDRPEPLFGVRGMRPGNIYDVSDDGQRLIVNQTPISRARATMVLVQNWPQLIEE
jgi:Tol biopolymer transport system component